MVDVLDTAAIIDEAARICRAGGASEAVLRWLAAQRLSTRRLVFRDAGRDDAGMSSYIVGNADAPKRFAPPMRQAEAVRALYLLSKHRGRFIALPLGKPGKRRGDKARDRLTNAAACIGKVAPELAEQLHPVEVCDNGQGPLLVKLPWHAKSAMIGF